MSDPEHLTRPAGVQEPAAAAGCIGTVQPSTSKHCSWLNCCSSWWSAAAGAQELSQELGSPGSMPGALRRGELQSDLALAEGAASRALAAAAAAVTPVAPPGFSVAGAAGQQQQCQQ